MVSHTVTALYFVEFKHIYSGGGLGIMVIQEKTTLYISIFTYHLSGIPRARSPVFCGVWTHPVAVAGVLVPGDPLASLWTASLGHHT